jgi:hypothetical protein
MGFLDLFRRLHRPHWFICYNCMNRNGHVAEEAIFFYDGPPEVERGRNWYRCPRCNDLNTRSFQQLADERSEAQLFGLEQIVKKNPRQRFPVKPHPAAVAR